MLKPYVQINTEENKLTFYFKNEILIDAIEEVATEDYFIDNDGLINYYVKDIPVAPLWNNRETIKTVIFDKSFKDFKPITTTHWFYHLDNLTEVIGLENLDTSEVTNMSWMFSDCYSLKNIDLSNFDTSKVTNISYMFAHCHSLETLDLSSFSNKSIIWENKPDEQDDNGYAAMFWDCPKLKTIYIGEKWDEKQPILPRSGWLFAECPSLVGGQGSRPFDPEYDGPYARIDGGQEKPGYFTLKEE